MNINNSITNPVGTSYNNVKKDKDLSSNTDFNNIINNYETTNDESSSSISDNTFKLFGPNAPKSVKDAWDKTVKETGMNGPSESADGKLSLSALVRIRINQMYLYGHSNVFGSSKESTIEVINEALHMLDNPLIPVTDPNIIKSQAKERHFYEVFLKNLSEI